MTNEAEIRVMQPQVKKCQQLQEAGVGKKQMFPKPLEGA